MRNSFNILLVILAAYDTWYMFGAILETIRKFFMNLRTHLHLRMFPHFLYPLHQTSITGSIFMTVALAFERYSALNYPMEYNRVSTTTLVGTLLLHSKVISLKIAPGKKTFQRIYYLQITYL